MPKKDQLLDVWKTLPLEIKEKILLKLPCDRVKFITNPRFWRKKIQLDFDVPVRKANGGLYKKLEAAQVFMDMEGVFLPPFDFFKDVLLIDSPFTNNLFKICIIPIIMETENHTPDFWMRNTIKRLFFLARNTLNNPIRVEALNEGIQILLEKNWKNDLLASQMRWLMEDPTRRPRYVRTIWWFS
jgi:hypothetical protein